MGSYSFAIRMALSTGLAALTLSSSSCTPKHRLGETTEEADLVMIDLPVAVDPARIDTAPSEVQETLSRVSDKKKVSFDFVTDVVVLEHLNEYNRSTKQSEKFADLSKKISIYIDGLTVSDPHQFKIDYERRIQDINGSAEISYERNSISIADTAFQSNLQCYSGTVLNQVLMRKVQRAALFESSHWVVIQEPGHVLPGYVKQENGKWFLYGIESTVSGEGRVSYGLTEKIHAPIRVFDANEWAFIQIAKFFVTNSEEMAKVSLKRTAEKYGLPLDVLEKEVAKVNTPQGNAVAANSDEIVAAQMLNASPLSFGKALHVPNGPVPRKSFTTKSVDRSGATPFHSGGEVGVLLNAVPPKLIQPALTLKEVMERFGMTRGLTLLDAVKFEQNIIDKFDRQLFFFEDGKVEDVNAWENLFVNRPKPDPKAEVYVIWSGQWESDGVVSLVKNTPVTHLIVRFDEVFLQINKSDSSRFAKECQQYFTKDAAMIPLESDCGRGMVQIADLMPLDALELYQYRQEQSFQLGLFPVAENPHPAPFTAKPPLFIELVREKNGSFPRSIWQGTPR